MYPSKYSNCHLLVCEGHFIADISHLRELREKKSQLYARLNSWFCLDLNKNLKNMQDSMHALQLSRDIVNGIIAKQKHI